MLIHRTTTWLKGVETTEDPLTLYPSAERGAPPVTMRVTTTYIEESDGTGMIFVSHTFCLPFLYKDSDVPAQPLTYDVVIQYSTIYEVCGGHVVRCRTCDHEVEGSNPARGCYVPTPTQRAILTGSVNEYQQKLGSKRACHAMH